MPSFDFLAANRLNRFLDERAGGGQPKRVLDPALVHTVKRLDALDGALDADPAFATRLLEELMATTAQPEILLPMLPIRPVSRNGRFHRGIVSDILTPGELPRSRSVMAQLATAALVILTLVGSFFAFGPGRRSGQVAMPAIIHPVVGTPATPNTGEAPVAEFVWETDGGPEMPFSTMPFANTVDPDGNLWVLDGARHQFQVFAPDGTYLQSWGTPGSGSGQFNFLVQVAGSWPSGDIDFDQDGNRYVSDPGNFRIQKFDADGTFITAWGSEGQDAGQFLWPGQVEVSPQGSVYVPDEFRHDVQVFDTDGNYVQTIGGRGDDDGQFDLGKGSSVTIDPSGNLVVVDSGHYRIQVFSPEGAFLTAWGEQGPGEGQFLIMGDVKVDHAGRVFVTDTGFNTVQIFSPAGAFLGSWGGSGGDPGEFLTPASIVLDGRGYAYVSDFGNKRVQKFRLLPPFAPEATAVASEGAVMA